MKKELGINVIELYIFNSLAIPLLSHFKNTFGPYSFLQFLQ